MQLLDALQLTAPASIAFVGAGGKTSAMFALARQLHLPVVVTTTTHLSQAQATFGDRFVEISSRSQLKVLFEGDKKVTVVAGPSADPTRVGGLAPELIEELWSEARSREISLLIEADGSRGWALKAPAAHEPVIPEWAEQVIVVAGLSGLGKPLAEGVVHRPEKFAVLSGLPLGELIVGEALARVLIDPQGGLKGIPTGCKRIALLNQADTPELQAEAHTIASRLIEDYERIIISTDLRIAIQDYRFGGAVSSELRDGTSVEQKDPPMSRMETVEKKKNERYGGPVVAVHTPIAGIILAGGQSSRLGQPKQLLLWRGEPFIRHIARMALRAGLSPVVVVTGAVKNEIEDALKDLQVVIRHNPDWEQGQSTSVRVGIAALPTETGAAVLMLSDQPQVPGTLVNALVEKHRQTLAKVIAPQVDGKRANPVLFDRTTFPDLLALTGETGGRAVFSKYPPSWIPWYDPGILIDVDSDEDYQKLLQIE